MADVDAGKVEVKNKGSKKVTKKRSNRWSAGLPQNKRLNLARSAKQ